MSHHRALRAGGFGSDSIQDNPTLPGHEIRRRASLLGPPDEDPLIKWRPARRLITLASLHIDRVLSDAATLTTAPLPGGGDDPTASAALKKAAAASVTCFVAWGVAISRPVVEAAQRYAKAPMETDAVSRFRLEPLSMWCTAHASRPPLSAA